MHLVPDKFDNAFKQIVSAGWANKSDGNVEAPCGYYALIEVPEHEGENVAMREAVTDFDKIEMNWPEPGWYTTTENSDGIILVFKHASQYAAQLAFNSIEASFLRWFSENPTFPKATFDSHNGDSAQV